MAVVRSFENVVDRSSTGEIGKRQRIKEPLLSMRRPRHVYGGHREGTRNWLWRPAPARQIMLVTTVDVDADGDSMLIYKHTGTQGQSAI